MTRGSEPSIVDRIVVAATAFFLLAAALLLAASALGWRGLGSLEHLAFEVAQSPVEAILAAALIVAAGLYLFVLAVQREREEGIRQETEMGHVHISHRAIANLVYRTARGVRGIKDVDVDVHSSPDGVAISLALVIHPDLQIPAISEEVGHKVRQYVREIVGVRVSNVAIDIRNIADETRARVE